MEKFLTEDFLLQSGTARELYHDYAEKMPILDYHCHLPPVQIAENKQFSTITEAWLGGDHYKWRAMRTNGVDEERITGQADDREKFRAWAETVPYTIGNPLYHWTHLELKRYFGIEGKLLNGKTADEIYDACNSWLAGEQYRARGLMKQMQVRAVCTTDDPADSLEDHRKISADEGFDIPGSDVYRYFKTTGECLCGQVPQVHHLIGLGKPVQSIGQSSAVPVIVVYKGLLQMFRRIQKTTLFEE